ncbi:unnamed protein product [Oikopleura dioica]|uniref:Uncharacterized protein n=1 Tax=Oikopleura dioica TaxID=34765 RepID=E4XEL5_OIKDI|nr:unnamed protein product [Oikopleura dioica]
MLRLCSKLACSNPLFVLNFRLQRPLEKGSGLSPSARHVRLQRLQNPTCAQRCSSNFRRACSSNPSHFQILRQNSFSFVHFFVHKIRDCTRILLRLICLKHTAEQFLSGSFAPFFKTSLCLEYNFYNLKASRRPFF